MSQQGRDEQGRYQETVSLDEVRQFFRDSEPHTATEIADELDLTNRAALNKLETLHEAGEIKRKDVGARAVVWYRELNPQMAVELLAETTGRPIDDFAIDTDEEPMPAPDEVAWEPINDN